MNLQIIVYIVIVVFQDYPRTLPATSTLSLNQKPSSPIPYSLDNCHAGRKDLFFTDDYSTDRCCLTRDLSHYNTLRLVQWLIMKTLPLPPESAADLSVAPSP